MLSTAALIDGTESAYDAAHATVWPELITAMHRAGISDWTIRRSGRDLFHRSSATTSTRP